MTRLPTLTVLLLALLAAPTASAWPWDDPVTITVGEQRADDRMLYVSDYHYAYTDQDGNRVHEQGTARATMLVEGPARAVDKFGIERDTISYVTAYEVEDESAQMRCHMLPSGQESVRAEYLTAPVSGWAEGDSRGSQIAGITLSSQSMTSEFEPVASFYPYACAPLNHPQGRVLREGDRLLASELFGKNVDEEEDLLSAPAVATQFHGRPALRFEYDLSQIEAPESAEPLAGTASFVFADGLPHVVHSTWARAGEDFSYSNTTLAGFEQGTGPVIAPPGDAKMPERNEGATWIRDPLVIDTRGLDLELSFEDAYAALLGEPRGEFRAWLGEHPDAVLYSAGYTAHSEGDTAPTSETGWSMMWIDGSSMFGAFASRPKAVFTPLGETRLPVAAPPTVVTFRQDDWDAVEVSTPGEVVDAATLAEIASGVGIEPGTIRGLVYFVSTDGAGLMVSQVDEQTPEGLVLYVNATAGALEFVGAESREYDRSGLLDLRAPSGNLGGAATTGSAFSALAGPVGASDLGLPAAAATGVALLLIAAKFLLIPLFTRLRRDRLLDNDVRARLYERVRAEPGIHRAELVDFAGIGEGATRHHLQQMVSHKLLVELEDGGFVRYFAAGEVPPSIARREMALRAGSQRRVYDLYVARPDVSLREAGALLGMSAPSVHRAKRKLEKAGLLPAAPTANVAPAEA